MIWENPALLWLGLGVLPVLFFYFLRMRFRRHPVSSLYIWSKLQSPIQGGNKLRRRSIFLLAFQLLAVTFAVMAAAQPFWSSKVQSQPSILYLIDCSASMTATDLSDAGFNPRRTEKSRNLARPQARSRLDAAKDYVAREIGKLPPKAVIMVIGCASGIKPVGKPTAQHQWLIRQLNKLQPSYAAFAEAKVTDELQTWLTLHKRPWRVVLITDGGLDLGGERLAAVLEGVLQTKIIGRNGNNLGVTALRVGASPAGTGAAAGEARFLIYNGWPTVRLVKVTLQHEWWPLRNNIPRYECNLLGEAVFEVKPGNSYQKMAFKGPVREGVYQIKIAQNSDPFTADDSYNLALNSPRKARVLNLAPENPFLRAALEHPLIDQKFRSDFKGVITGEGLDLVVAEQKPVPEGMLRCNMLTFGIVPDTSPYCPVILGSPVTGAFTPAGINHPLLRYLDWQQVHTNDSFSLKTSQTPRAAAAFLVTVDKKPVLAVWEEPGGWRRVSFGMDLYHTNLGISGAFPVFMANLLQWILPQFNNPLAYTLNVGEPVTLGEPEEWQVLKTCLKKVTGIEHSANIKQPNRLRNPVAKIWTATADTPVAANRRGPFITLTGFTPGVFQWGRGKEKGLIAVNTAPQEMEIAPRPLQLKPTDSITTVGDFSDRIPLAPWLLALLFLALLAEWAIWRGLPFLK